MPDPTPATPTRFQCRHIFTDGHRCGSVSLRHEEFCFYHHTSRRPTPAEPESPTENATPHRRSRRAPFTLPIPEDRGSVQLSISEVIHRIASNAIDPRRAALLLYALQIAASNLPRRPTPRPEPTATPGTVEDIILDPTLGPLAPPTEFVGPRREKTLEEIVMEQWNKEP